MRLLKTPFLTMPTCLTAFCMLIVAPWIAMAEVEDPLADPNTAIESFNSGLEMLFDEDELFISATQSARTLDKAPAIATVITAKQLKNMGARNLLDALDMVPGFGVAYPSEFSVVNSLEVRGIKTDATEKVLFMIDGHKLNNPFGGNWTFAFEEMPINNIKRIEIIRGPGSALYGANAFVAVINVITKTATNQTRTDISGWIGNDQQQKESLFLSKKSDSLGLAAFFDHRETNSNRQTIAQDALGTSGETNNWGNSNFFYSTINYGKIGFQGGLMQKKRGVPLTISNLIDFSTEVNIKQAFAKTSYTNKVDDLSYTVSLDIDQFWFDPTWDLRAPGVAITNPQATNRTIVPALQIQYNLDNYFFTFGAEYEDIRQFDVRHIVNGIDVSTIANHNQDVDRQIYAAYVQGEFEVSKSAIITAGIRWDHYSDFGNTFNPRIAFVFSPTNSIDFKALYGRAFRTPTFLELYEINNPAALGNPNLEPEVMNTWEASVTWEALPGVKLTSDIFYNKFSDRIVRQLPLSANQGGATIWGVESEISIDLQENLYANLNYAYQNTEDDTTGNAIADVPKHRFKAGVNFGVLNDLLVIHSDLRWTGERPRAVGDTRTATPSNTVVDLNLRSEELLEKIELALSVHNLFDEDVIDPSPAFIPPGFTNIVAPGFPRPGRTWLLEGTYHF